MAEKKEITTRSPSHDGLCDESPSGIGLSYYRLPSGRYCVAYSCAAGIEHTGRGGERIFTRALILSAPDMAAFNHDPFTVLSAMRAAGLCRPELPEAFENTLDAIELPVDVGPLTSDSNTEEPVPWNPALTNTLNALLAGERVIVMAPRDTWGVARMLMLSLPAGRRAKVSLACGLRFSVGRCLDLNVIADDAGRSRRLVRGQSVTFIDLSEPPKSARADESAWSRWVAGRWQRGQAAELRDVTARFSDDLPNSELDEFANLLLDGEGIEALSGSQLLQRLAAHRARRPATALGRERLIELQRAIGLRLIELARREGRDAAPAWYEALCAALRTESAPLEILVTVTGEVWRARAVLHPLKALEAALHWMEIDPKGIAAQLLESDLVAVISAAAAGMYRIAEKDQPRLASVLQRWCQLRPHDESARELLHRMRP